MARWRMFLIASSLAIVTTIPILAHKEGDGLGRPLRRADGSVSMLVAGTRLRLGRLEIVIYKLGPATDSRHVGFGMRSLLIEETTALGIRLGTLPLAARRWALGRWGAGPW